MFSSHDAFLWLKIYYFWIKIKFILKIKNKLKIHAQLVHLYSRGSKKDNSDERRCKENEKTLQRAMRT